MRAPALFFPLILAGCAHKEPEPQTLPHPQDAANKIDVEIAAKRAELKKIEQELAAKVKARRLREEAAAAPYDTRKGPFRIGDMEISFPSAGYYHPTYLLRDDKEFRDPDAVFMIGVEIRNVSTNGLFHYRTWAPRYATGFAFSDPPGAKDDFGNRYKFIQRKKFRIKGEHEEATVRAGEQVNDLLRIEDPVPNAKHILLELPLGNLDISHPASKTFLIPIEKHPR